MKSINDRLNNAIRVNDIDESKLNMNSFYKDYLAPALEDMFYNMNMEHVSDPSEVDFLKACELFADRYYHA